jgi:hypothetical protein
MAVTRTSATAVAIAAGTYTNGIPPSTETYAGGTVTTIPAAGAGDHRYDLIYLDCTDGAVKREAGVEGTPSNAAEFLENAVPQPSDLPAENCILLAVICVDDSGIVAGDFGSYATAGVADMRIVSAVGAHLVSYLYDSGEAQGDLIYRGAANWDNLGAGTSGRYLKTQGAAANPTWDDLQVSSLTVASQARGDLIMRGATAWGRVAAGSANRYLMSNGAAADLSYELLKVGSLYHASEAQGCIATRNVTAWTVLAPGTAGHVLQSGGAGADLSYASIASILGTSEFDGWIPAGETWTYASADATVNTYTFTIPGDKTAKYSPGMRIKLTQTTAKYFIVTAVSYGAPNTTITVYGGTDYVLTSDAVTSPFCSSQKAPAGFPLSPAKWTHTFATGTGSQNNPTTDTWYNLGSRSSVVPVGAWDVFSWWADVEGTIGSAGKISMYMSLNPAANGSGAHAVFSTIGEGYTTNSLLVAIPSVKYYPYVSTTKTTLYAIFKINGPNLSRLETYGSTWHFVSAYL